MFSGLPCILHVLHGGGGTEAHVRTLAESTRGTLRHVLATVRGDTWRLEEHRADGTLMTSEFGRREDEAPEAFVRMLCAVFGVGIVHVHNISGSRESLLDALPRLGIRYGCTIHDLNFACPTITLHRRDGFYCGAVTDVATCQACLASQPGFEDIDIARWRERHGKVLAGAAFVIAPTRWAADTLRRYFPGLDVTVIAHALPHRSPGRHQGTQVVLIPDDEWPTVAVLGAIGPDKGSRRTERLAELAAARDAPLRFVVVGYLDSRQQAWQSEDGRLTVNGGYDPRDLPALLDYYRAALVLFPSAGPETFAFTLSEAWAAGRPVLVPPIGGLAERVDHHGAGWVMTEEEWRDEAAMLDRILDLLSPSNAVAIENAGLRAAHMPLPSLDGMVEATMRLYAAAARSRNDSEPVDRLRFVEAMGYRRWTPPPVESVVTVGETAIEPPPGLARTARRFGRTALGRMILRLMPPSTVDALKARLR
jgi:glycosyltransferase involved in cell wall biosynthesis